MTQIRENLVELLGSSNGAALPDMGCWLAMYLCLLLPPPLPAEEKAPPDPPLRVERMFKGHSRTAYSVAFSPDGKLLASGGDRSLWVWNAATGNPVREVSLDSNSITQACFVGGGRQIACTATGTGIHLVDTQSGKARGILNLSYESIQMMEASPDGKHLVFLASGSGGTVIVYDISNGKPRWCLVRTEQLNETRFLSVTPDGKTVVVVKGDGSLRYHDLMEGKELRRVKLQSSSSHGKWKFSPQGRFLAMEVVWSDTIRLMDSTTGEAIRELRWGEGRGRQDRERRRKATTLVAPARVWGLAISPDEKTLAANCSDDKIRIWEVATGGLRHESSQGGGAVVFSPDGARLAFASAKGGDLRICEWLNLDVKYPRLTATRLEQLWGNLAAKESKVAYRAMAELAQSPTEAVKLLNTRLRRMPAVIPAELDQLVADLDSKQFRIREQASLKLAALGRSPESRLRDALTRQPSLELRARIKVLLDQLPGGDEKLRQLRCVELLEYLKTPGARVLLQKIANGSTESSETEDAIAALKRIKEPDLP